MSCFSDSKRFRRTMSHLIRTLGALLLLLLVLTIVFFATRSCRFDPADEEASSETDRTQEGTSDDPAESDTVTLAETPDAGIAYQDSIVFVGDSLTAHLINRGVLTGGQETKQVWRTESNMLNLKPGITSQKIIYPETAESLTIAEAAGRKKPKILLITLGTDWGVAYLSETDFKACYAELVQEIRKASPDTTVILQSIFPVTADAKLDNQKIDTANRWVKAVAAENGCRYLDTQSILKDENNCLKAEYCNSTDGIHLGTEAYKAILTYIRTHAVP